jgi:hypothetical protein
MRGIVEHVGTKIGPVWPHDCAGIKVDTNVREVGLILQGCEHTTAAVDP